MEGGLKKILGLKNHYMEVIRKKQVIEGFPANVETDVRTIFIHCSSVKDSYVDDNRILIKKDLLYTFVPNNEPNSWLVFSPNLKKKFEI